VPSELASEFDPWLNGPHLDAVEGRPGIVQVRTWRQNKDDVPRRFPYDRYVGKGNRMIVAELDAGADLRRLFEHEVVRKTRVDSPRWDLRLGYVRREACEHLLTRYSGDAEREAAVGATPA